MALPFIANPWQWLTLATVKPSAMRPVLECIEVSDDGHLMAATDSFMFFMVRTEQPVLRDGLYRAADMGRQDGQFPNWTSFTTAELPVSDYVWFDTGAGEVAAVLASAQSVYKGVHENMVEDFMISLPLPDQASHLRFNPSMLAAAWRGLRRPDDDQEIHLSFDRRYHTLPPMLVMSAKFRHGWRKAVMMPQRLPGYQVKEEQPPAPLYRLDRFLARTRLNLTPAEKELKLKILAHGWTAASSSHARPVSYQELVRHFGADIVALNTVLRQMIKQGQLSKSVGNTYRLNTHAA